MIIEIDTGNGLQKSYVSILRYDGDVTVFVHLTQPIVIIHVDIKGIDDFGIIPDISDTCNKDVFIESLKGNLQVKAVINRFFIGKNKNTSKIMYGDSDKEFNDWLNESL